MMIQCIIVEDEPKAMSLMEEYITRTPFLKLSGKFFNALSAINYLNENEQPDIIFLDINLPELSGMDMAKIISPALKVIFTTAYSDYAVTSYEVNTIDYLLKPIVYSRFLQAVSKAKKLIQKEKEESVTKTDSHVFLKSGKKIIQISWDEILYIEALREYLSIVTLAQKIVVYKRMTEFENMQPVNFKRVHNSYIVNLDKIDKVEDNIVYINNTQIPIGKTFKESFYTAIKNKLL